MRGYKPEAAEAGLRNQKDNEISNLKDEIGELKTEIVGLKGEIKVLLQRLALAAEQLELADKRYEAIVNQVKELEEEVARQDKEITKLENELKKTAVAPVRLNELAASNTEIKKLLTDLSTSTTTLGQALEIVRGITHKSE
jgi:chromosome segregation ATPase